jgi:mannose-6-phosphate isomerase-like protein (cupin superfamily)
MLHENLTSKSPQHYRCRAHLAASLSRSIVQLIFRMGDGESTDSPDVGPDTRAGLLPVNEPPAKAEPYFIPQLEGEKITIPGSKGVFRILASSKQTQNKIAVFTSGAVLSDAPGFHFHNEAHDVFLVTKGYLKLWNGDKCRILGPGDFAYVPPKVIHNPEMLGPHTELIGLIAPGDWVDFFRYVAEPDDSIIVPEFDNRDLKAHIIPKLMAAGDRFDVQFVRDYQPPMVSDWGEDEERIPDGQESYYLRFMTGPRWMAGGLMSRPFITTKQNGGRFAIASIETSNNYPPPELFSKDLVFEEVDHCFCVQEGCLSVVLDGHETLVREGETLVVPAGSAFSLQARSRYVRVYSFTSGDGLEALIYTAGESYKGFVLPNQAPELELSRLSSALNNLKIKLA